MDLSPQKSIKAMDSIIFKEHEIWNHMSGFKAQT